MLVKVLWFRPQTACLHSQASDKSGKSPGPRLSLRLNPGCRVPGPSPGQKAHGAETRRERPSVGSRGLPSHVPSLPACPALSPRRLAAGGPLCWLPADRVGPAEGKGEKAACLLRSLRAAAAGAAVCLHEEAGPAHGPRTGLRQPSAPSSSWHLRLPVPGASHPFLTSPFSKQNLHQHLFSENCFRPGPGPTSLPRTGLSPRKKNLETESVE